MKKKLTVMRRVVVAILLFAFFTATAEQEVYAVENKVRVEDGNTAVNIVLPEYGTCFMGGKTVYSDGTGRLKCF